MIGRAAAALACGIIFGIGLAVSQMAYPLKVIGFLNVTGAWDASLLLVLGGAVAVTAIGFRAARRIKTPAFERTFEDAPPETIDARLVTGAAIFGVGWGLAGYCPGPGIVSVGRLAPDAFVFVAAFFIGSAAVRYAGRLRATSPNPNRALAR